MTSAVAVYRPHGRVWVLYGFITLLLGLNSLYWFFDPGPIWVRFVGGAILAYWAALLVGLARTRVELRPDTIEIYGPGYAVLPSRRGSWLYGLLVVFVLWDLAGLLWGPLPRAAHLARLALSLLWLAAYFLNLVRQLPRGRRSIAYADIEGAPWEEEWGPYRKLNPRHALFLRVAHEPEATLLPPWLDEDDRRELAGRIAARVKHAHAGQTP